MNPGLLAFLNGPGLTDLPLAMIALGVILLALAIWLSR